MFRRDIDTQVISQDKQDIIFQRLEETEQQHRVKVLYAIESGSRAWGFASPNSDYDVRFIYAHSVEWYLSVDLEYRRNVIEHDIVDEMDINGWDIRKALNLLRRSNPSIVEWLQSTIVYVDNQHFAEGARDILSRCYRPERGIYHYRSMASNNFRGFLSATQVPLKKYFYVIRPLLAVRWLEQFHTPAPLDFDELRGTFPELSKINQILDDLLSRKIKSQEKELIEPIPELNQFIQSEMQRLESFAPPHTLPATEECIQQLNTLFREAIHFQTA